MAREIVDHAEEAQVDRSVMSSHGFSGVSRWVRGSVAEKVLAGAAYSTLVVRAWPDREEGLGA